jgi:hypothetical protein
VSERIWNTLEGGQMGTPPVMDASEALGVEPGTAILMNVSGVPDVVRLPDEMGGRTLRVLGRTAFPMHCPTCAQERKMEGYDLEDRFVVGSCPGCSMYVWGRRPTPAGAGETGTR